MTAVMEPATAAAAAVVQTPEFQKWATGTTTITELFDAARPPCPWWCDRTCEEFGHFGDAVLHSSRPASVPAIADRIGDKGSVKVITSRYDALTGPSETRIEVRVDEAGTLVGDAAYFTIEQARQLAGEIMAAANNGELDTREAMSKLLHPAAADAQGVGWCSRCKANRTIVGRRKESATGVIRVKGRCSTCGKGDHAALVGINDEPREMVVPVLDVRPGDLMEAADGQWLEVYLACFDAPTDDAAIHLTVDAENYPELNGDENPDFRFGFEDKVVIRRKPVLR